MSTPSTRPYHGPEASYGYSASFRPTQTFPFARGSRVSWGHHHVRYMQHHPRAIVEKSVTDLVLSDGSTYTGTLRNDVIYGQGKRVFPSGETIEGWWTSEGLSYGTITYAPNSPYRQYTGDFLEDKLHGVGLLILRNGCSINGEWYAGQPHGWVRCMNTDRMVYEGQVFNWKKHGEGKIYDSQGRLLFEGRWKDDQPIIIEPRK